MLSKQVMQLNKLKNFKRGFTMIELLVAVAIISILATVVMVSVSSARDKNADSAIKIELRTIQTQAELYFQKNKGYAPLVNFGGGLCPMSVNQGYGMFTADPIVNLAARAIMKKVKYPNVLGSSLCVATPKTWVAVARLRSFPISIINGVAVPSDTDHLCGYRSCYFQYLR